MDTGIDFTYFSQPIPYAFYGLPPTPQGQTPQADDYKTFDNNQYDPGFAAFQQNFHYDPSQYAIQQPPHHVPSVSPPTHRTTSFDALPDQSQDIGGDEDVSPFDHAGGLRSSSEERENFTPQQNKRKAQNRAAQRAFRERKEKHVKELEQRNTCLQHESITLQNEVEKLRRELHRANAENDILKATSGSSMNGPSPFLLESERDDLDSVVPGPQMYTPTDYTSKLRATRDRTTEWSPNSKWAQFGLNVATPVDDASGEPLYTAGQTWDYIQNHERFKKGLVDVGDVCERLKKMARCDGQGPVFQESDIRQAIQESAVAGGRDELI